MSTIDEVHWGGKDRLSNVEDAVKAIQTGGSIPAVAPFAQLMSRLQQGVENTVLQVIGDSTGVGTTRWPYLVATWLAGQFPAYTVLFQNWNDTNQNYDAASTLQAGSDSRSFTDGATTSGSSTLTSAAGASFTSSDIGRPVSGTGIPAGTTISAFTSATQVTMSANATATNTGVTVTLGAHTLNVYNGSTSGQDVAYTSTRITAQIPVTPNVIVLNYGHNSGTLNGLGYRPGYLSLLRQFQDYYPSAGIVCTAQNPRAGTDTNKGYDLSRQAEIVDICASEGFGLINVAQKFLSDANYAADYLNADGLHPNDATGSPLWAQLVETAMSESVYVQPRSAPIRMQRIYIPAAAMIASGDGTPTLAVKGAASSPFQTWELVDAATSGVLAEVDWPNGWKTVNIYAVWSVATGSGYTGSNNGCVFEIGYAQAGSTGTVFFSPTGSGSAGVPPALTTANTTGTATNSGAWETLYTRIGNGLTLPAHPVAIRVRRLGANGSDTLAESAYLRGLFIERAS